MAIQIYVSVVLREQCGGRSTFELDSSTIGELIEAIDGNYPGFSNHIFQTDGQLQKTIRISVNGNEVASSNIPGRHLNDGDRVFLLYAIAGG